MKITQLIEGAKPQKIPASKPRNFVAKNATSGGAGAHKDKKKAAKQGDVKHKNKDMEMAEARANTASVRAGLAKRKDATPLSPEEQAAKDKAKSDKWLEKERAKMAAKKKVGEDFTDTVKSTVNKVGDTLANALPKDMRPFDNDTAAKNAEAQKTTPKLASIKESIEEAMYRRPGSPTAYDRDYASSVSGMGRKDSLAYQMDGGANDEGWDEEPYQHPSDKPVLKGYYFYDVPPGKENLAAIYGVKRTKSGKWAKALYSTSGRSYAMQKNGADKEFGPGKWWAPK